MIVSEYLADPCRASALPFWKTETVTVPRGVRIVRDDDFALLPGETDEPYFKLIHELRTVRAVPLPEGYELADCGAEELALHIDSCYEREHITADELIRCRLRPVFRPELWIAVRSKSDGAIACSGIAELDGRIGEGVLEWIQVSPEHRRKGLGAFVVCELLERMRGEARFVTVSGRVNSQDRPIALYTACGFTGEVIWHVVSE